MLGSGQNGELTFLDAIGIASFLIGIQNLDINLTQDDLSKAADNLLKEIHGHLQMQDDKIDQILEEVRK